MRVSHALSPAPPTFDDPNLIAHAGLVPALRLAERAGLYDLVGEHVRLPRSQPGGAYAPEKVVGIVAGMLVGADSIDDLDVLRHGGTGRVFWELRAPSTFGTFLRAFTHGHVRQVDAVSSRFLTGLAAQAAVLPDAGEVVHVDIDDTIRQTYGYAKQGAGYGYSKVKGLNAQLVIASTPTSAPVIAAARLRKGSTASARGAPKLLGDALATIKRAITATSTAASTAATTAAAAGQAVGTKPAGLVIVRADSAYYNHGVVATVVRARPRFSITARMNVSVAQAIAGIQESAWTPITYPNAVWDETEQRLVSDADVAEVAYTAFTSRRRADHVNARLIVRRVKRLNTTTGPTAVGDGQTELFATYRYHAVFTNSPLSMIAAEADHRRHAIIETVFSDLKDFALAHLPSGKFNANAAWLGFATIAYNLTRGLAVIAAGTHARARTATIRRRFITVPARVASSARRSVLHLPTGWRFEDALHRLFTATASSPIRC